ncbi:hypothetical protein [Ornithinimicrobium cryptoxanthini]|uniref:MinD-like ATPase involved in chromosome partitioning or flagellar assembly n=1 Tax=Ornithinimicrobium cryptoxanthini TaxID=2934161 RepID=A0ABY4YM46_9MICO|nr:hypothetical protein [Ornithinimicrobium cryptoxanthini]USQ77791.1 hypothetical protein NF557_07825 [Ornithinimicrobium cryptoxanthini]
MSVVSVDELQRAWRAVQDGQFRPGAPDHRPTRARARARASKGDTCPNWLPTAGVLPVLGCHGSAGATTLAVAVATVLARPVRVVEASSAGASGLAGFATAEMGGTGTGWLRGRRDDLVLDRLEDGYASLRDLPLPDPDPTEGSPSLNILDVGWAVETLAMSPGWVRSTVLGARDLLLVTTATVPGLRRLEGALHELDTSSVRLVVAVQGPKRRRWPREVTHCVRSRTATVLDEALVEIAHDPAMAIRGLDTSPLPGALLSAAATITQLLALGSSPDHHKKGNTHVR